MAWTDYSITEANAWDPAIGTSTSSTAVIEPNDNFDLVVAATLASTYPYITVVNSVTEHFNIPGFDVGWQPSSTPSPINNNIDQASGGGGSARPSSGFLYPRGQG